MQKINYGGIFVTDRSMGINFEDSTPSDHILLTSHVWRRGWLWKWTALSMVRMLPMIPSVVRIFSLRDFACSGFGITMCLRKQKL